MKSDHPLALLYYDALAFAVDRKILDPQDVQDFASFCVLIAIEQKIFDNNFKQREFFVICHQEYLARLNAPVFESEENPKLTLH